MNKDICLHTISNENGRIFKNSAKFWKRGRCAGGINEYTHKKNGLKVYIMPSAVKNSVVTFNVAYDVGSRCEKAGEYGNAHFLEHALFKNTNTWQFQSCGAQINAMTQCDLTNFYATLPAHELWKWMANEASRMTSTHFTEAQVRSEATVVRNEYEISAANPANCLYKEMLKAALNINSTIGIVHDFTNATAQSLNSFWRRYYTANRAAIICSGNLPSQNGQSGIVSTLNAIHAHFGAIAASNDVIDSVSGQTPLQFGPKCVHVSHLETKANIVSLAFQAPSASSRDSLVMCLISKMINNRTGRAAPLLKSGLFYEIGANNSQFRQNNLWMLTGGIGQVSMKAQNIGLQALLTIVESYVSSAPCAAELLLAKTELLREYNLEGMMSNTEKVMKINQFVCRTFNAFHGHECASIIPAITTCDVQRVAQKYFKERYMTTGTYFPAKTVCKHSASVENVQTTVSQEFSKTAKYSVAPSLTCGDNASETLISCGDCFGEKYTCETYNNKALTVQFGSIPVANNTYATISLLGAGLDHQKSNPHIVNVLGQMLFQGVRQNDRIVSAEEISALMREKRIKLQFSAKHATFDIHIECPKEHTNVAVGLVSKLIQYPMLPIAAFKGIQQKFIAQVQSQTQSVDAQATNLLFHSMFPQEHPNHAVFPKAQILQIQTLTHAAVVEFHQSLLSAPRIMTMLSADHELQHTASILTPLCVDIPIRCNPRKATCMPPASHVSKFMSGQENVAFRMGCPINLTAQHVDYLALKVASNALAGSFGTRLMEVIREKEGLTYGIGGRICEGSLKIAFSSAFVINSSCNPDLLKQLEHDTICVVREFIEGGMTQHELEAQKSFAKGVVTVQNDNVHCLLGMLHDNILHGKSAHYLDTLHARVDALTLEHVNKIMRQHFDIAKFSFARVGSLHAADMAMPKTCVQSCSQCGKSHHNPECSQ